MQNIKHNLIQGNNRENKSDGFDFSGVSEIHDLCFKNEFDRVNCFSYIIAVVYAISLVINRGGILPYLLQYYKDNYDLELDGSSIEKYNDLNDLNDHYDNIVRKELDKYV